MSAVSCIEKARRWGGPKSGFGCAFSMLGWVSRRSASSDCVMTPRSSDSRSRRAMDMLPEKAMVILVSESVFIVHEPLYLLVVLSNGIHRKGVRWRGTNL